MTRWFGRMEPREKAALLVWASAVVMVVALAQSYPHAPKECFYSPEDFSRCDPWRAIAALGDAATTALLAAALWITRTPATTWLHRIARVVGAVGLPVATAGSLAALVGDAYLVARPLAALGFAGLGFALSLESDRGNPLVRSRLGVIVGITLALWAIGYVPRDDRILPTGGAFFFVPYLVWATRLGYRFGIGKAPVRREPRPVELKLVGNAAGIVLFFLALPFWIASSFGVATIGDPANTVTVKNETGASIVFYQDRRLPQYSQRLEAGETKAWAWPEHGAYSPAAEDLTGTKIFCRHLLDRELRRAHYQITVVPDPAACDY